jgi:hypothetical protein
MKKLLKINSKCRRFLTVNINLSGIASGSVPGTPAPTPISPSPSLIHNIHPDQIAASIARYVQSLMLITQLSGKATTTARVFFKFFSLPYLNTADLLATVEYFSRLIN